MFVDEHSWEDMVEHDDGIEVETMLVSATQPDSAILIGANRHSSQS